MGYDFHITRAEDWSQSETNPIRAEEWLAIVADDPELTLDASNGPYFAVWSGDTTDPERAWFDWSHGRVFTKNPNRATLRKMLGVAERLGALVQGDDGEPHTDASEISDTPTPVERSVLRWQRLMSAVGPIVLLLSVLWLVWKAVWWARGP